MRKIVKLSEKQIETLGKLPEKGMGHHLVNIKLNDGTALSKRSVLNGEFLVIESSETVSSSDIKTIKLIK